jgi:hypothetical protein
MEIRNTLSTEKIKFKEIRVSMKQLQEAKLHKNYNSKLDTMQSLTINKARKRFHSHVMETIAT